VKPANIFLANDTAGFRVKILDFGLAKSTTVDSALTRTGVVVGTPAYMAPEQVKGEEVDERTDVYAFAAVSYEALTGIRIAAGTDLVMVLRSVLDSVPPPPTSILDGLPPAVDAAFQCALAKDRATRVSDIAQWGSDLARVLADAAVPPDMIPWPS
jgi:serine/threonine protein kinase